MKTATQISLLLATFLLTACREDPGPETQAGIEPILLSPSEGERWVYKVEVSLDPTAQIPSGVIDAGPEGSETTYQKERRYLGLKPLKANSDEQAHCFEISKDRRVQELEFSLIDERGISTRAWQEAGKERILMEAVLLVPTSEVPGSVWSMSLPDPNDPGGAPMFYRQFQYYGLEEILVMGQSQKAHRIKVFGKTGPVELQRDFWFVNQLGFVKERKSYYSEKTRLALIEEVLIEHYLPE